MLMKRVMPPRATYENENQSENQLALRAVQQSFFAQLRTVHLCARFHQDRFCANVACAPKDYIGRRYQFLVYFFVWCGSGRDGTTTKLEISIIEQQPLLYDMIFSNGPNRTATLLLCDVSSRPEISAHDSAMNRESQNWNTTLRYAARVAATFTGVVVAVVGLVQMCANKIWCTI